MFENIIRDNNNGLKNLNPLLEKFGELRRFQDFYRIHKNKKQLKTHKQKILKLINIELKKRLKPEETFEVWHQQKNLNINLEKQKKLQSLGEIIKTLNNEDENRDPDATVVDSIEDDDEDNRSNEIAIQQLKKFTDSFDNTDNLVKSQFSVLTSGLELFPDNNKPSFIRKHIKALTSILHINLLRKNWNLAYKSFCLLIKFPIVDLRSIWPLGIEILRNVSPVKPDALIKDEKFFEWLSSYYVVNHVSSAGRSMPSRLIGAPIWRTGSKTLPPLYIVAALWDLLAKHEYTKLQSKLEELMLQPPYDSDGLMYFLLALCKLGEGIQLANESDTPRLINELSAVLKSVQTDLKKVQSLGFLYPKELIEKQISIIKQFVGEDLNESSSSESEEEFDVDENTAQIENQLHYEDEEDDFFDDLNEIEDDKEANDKETIVEEQLGVVQDNSLDFEFDFD